MRLGKSPYRHFLEEDEDFNRWFNNVRRGSILTAEEWLRRMGRIHKRFGKTPAEIGKMRQKQAVNFILDMITELENEGKSGSYIANCVKPVKNWLSWNGVHIQQKIKIPKRTILTTVADERTPTPDELGKIFNMADFRARAAATGIALAGLRLESLGNYTGDDGLKVKDLPEMEILADNAEVRFLKVPTMVVVRPNLSKAGHQYFSFLPEQGCEFVKEYLEWRIRKGQKFSADTPLLTPKTDFVGKHISTVNIGDLIRQPIRRAGFKWRPYVLRRYFDTRMMVAESDGLIIRDFRVFWMGHKGDMENTYTTNKRLSDDVVERMRKAYEKAAEKHLVTGRRSGMSEDMVRAQFNRQFLELGGLSAEETERLGDLAKLSTADLNRLIQDKQKSKMGLNGNSQKIVPMEDLERYITEGWEYVRDLPNGKAIVRLPK